MDKKIIKEKINVKHLASGLKQDPEIILAAIDEIFALWEKLEQFEGFPCVDSCTDCCSNAAITCTTIEFEIMKLAVPESTNGGLGCPFKTKKGCSVYRFRPLVCRLFGYVVPFKYPVIRIREELAGEIFDWLVITPGYCLKKKNTTPIPENVFIEIIQTYKEIVEKTGIVIVGSFKDKDLNRGLAIIDKFWTAKKNMPIWHKD
jgi:Fe-S-cluster containining protein